VPTGARIAATMFAVCSSRCKHGISCHDLSRPGSGRPGGRRVHR
jgi:hypothetical protein